MSILACLATILLVIFSILELSGPEGDFISAELYNAIMKKTVLKGWAGLCVWYLYESDFGTIAAPKYLTRTFKAGGIWILAEITFDVWNALFSRKTNRLTNSEYLRYAYIEKVMSERCVGSESSDLKCSGRGLCIRYLCECPVGYTGQYCEKLEEQDPSEHAAKLDDSEAGDNWLRWINLTGWAILRWLFRWLIHNGLSVAAVLLTVTYVVASWQEGVLRAVL